MKRAKVLEKITGRNGFEKKVNIFGNGEGIKIKERRAKEKKKYITDNKRKNTYRSNKMYERLLIKSFKTG